MQFTVAAVLALAAGASAHFNNATQVYVTEVVTSLTTYCPVATEITQCGNTYSVTEATTLTITDCPITITKPVTTTSVVECKVCNGTASTQPPAPVVTKSTTVPVGTGSVTPTAPSSVPTAGAGKLAALSGAGLAGIVGFAALL